MKLLGTLSVCCRLEIEASFLFWGSWDPGAVGVTISVWFVRFLRAPEGSCFVERGLGRGEATDVLGVFCRMVTSSVVG